MMKTYDTVILANGAFPTAEPPLCVLRAARRIVCCDGAADALVAVGLEPTVVIGDGDSISTVVRDRLADRFVHVAEQETNDLAKAFRHCLANGWTSIAILGATGLREDHTLANLSLLGDFSASADVVLFTDTGLFTPVSRSTQFSAFSGQAVSIFSFESGLRMYAEGLAYPLDGVSFTRWWNAALNCATGDSFKLTFLGGPVLVFQSYEQGNVS